MQDAPTRAHGLKFRIAAFLVVGVLVFGTVGYHVIEGWGPLESVYMTVITVSTVGFHEVRPLGPQGRVFTIVLIMSSLGTVAFGISTIATYVFEGHLLEAARRRRMDKSLARMKGHFVICGANETALQAGRDLLEDGREVVFVTETPEKVTEELGYDRVVVVAGPPTVDATLRQARVTEAAGLVAALEDDADNLFVVITARNLAPQLQISARCELETSIDKVRLAGADHVVLPSVVGGSRLASALIRPQVVAFLDSVIRGTEVDLRLEQAVVPEGSPLCGKTLSDARVPQQTGLIVIAIKKAEESFFRFNPGASTEIDPADTLIVMGYQEQIERMRRLLLPEAGEGGGGDDGRGGEELSDAAAVD